MSFMGRHVVGLCAPEEDPYDEAVDDALSDTRLIEILESFGFTIPGIASIGSLDQDEVYYSDRLTKKDCTFSVYVSHGPALCIELYEANDGPTLSETVEIPLGHVPMFDDFYKEVTETLVYMCETDDRDLTLADVLRGE